LVHEAHPVEFSGMSSSTSRYPTLRPTTEPNKLRVIAGVIVLTALSITIHGYHVGVEDQDVYLAAAKKWLNPGLFPVNAEFFMEQMKASAFIPALAWTARMVSMPWALALWHVISLFLILLGCRRIAELCFSSETARWAAVVLVVTMLTLPIAGTALYPVDQYLHPRAPAAAGILLGTAAALRQRWIQTALWMTFAAIMHPLMAAFGISLLVFLFIPWGKAPIAALLLPFGWFTSVSPAWKEAAKARTYYFPLQWAWYEWLGVIAPVALVWWAGRLARSRKWTALERIAHRLLLFALFQFTIAMVLTVPAATMQLSALQPMRWLHIFYFFFLIIAGGLLGEFLLKEHVWRWIAAFGLLGGIMFYAQRDTFAHSDHVEWPGRSPSNQWAQAFVWIRTNTPAGAVFAMDPNYMESPAEDAYGFRAWAERSMLAENQKDPGAVTVFPSLARKWQEQVHAQTGIEKFDRTQFDELHSRFGVTWVVLPNIPNPPLPCPYHNTAVMVCQIR
jgi:hypothetical protein